MSAEADRLGAALAIALYDAHPTYASTSGWRGGIGGSALIAGCSLIDPPPTQGWLDGSLDLLSTPLREYLTAHPDFDLNKAKDDLANELKALLKEES